MHTDHLVTVSLFACMRIQLSVLHWLIPSPSGIGRWHVISSSSLLLRKVRDSFLHTLANKNFSFVLYSRFFASREAFEDDLSLPLWNLSRYVPAPLMTNTSIRELVRNAYREMTVAEALEDIYIEILYLETLCALTRTRYPL